MDSWTYDANATALSGLNPATYATAYPPSGYQPSVLVSDAASAGSATISLSSYSSGGLGSSGFLDGYGGFYTFFTASVTFTLQASVVLSDVDTITFSFLAGGGNPTPLTFSQSALALNFNPGNTAVAAADFSAEGGVIVPTPIGDQELTQYTWTCFVAGPLTSAFARRRFRRE